MEIFVSELPKDCLDCPCYCGEFMRCNLIHCEHSVGYFNEDELDYKHIPISQEYEKLICPLKLLSDRLAEERQKVVQEIREHINDRMQNEEYFITRDENGEPITTMATICSNYTINELSYIIKFLDQIERSE